MIANGLHVKGASLADQVTKYLYGVSRTASVTPSKVSSGQMLRAVIYPDSTNATAMASTIDVGS